MSTVEQREDPRQYCSNCGDPHYLWVENPRRFQPCCVLDGYDEDGTELVSTLRHKWPADIHPGSGCPCMRREARD